MYLQTHAMDVDGLTEVKGLYQQANKKEEIQSCFNEVGPHLYKIVMESFDKRGRMCQQNRGDHVLDLLFRT